MKMKCERCQKRYGKRLPEAAIRDGGWPQDDDWRPEGGLCYPCYLDIVYAIFGPYFSPVLQLNGREWTENGCLARFEDIPEIELPQGEVPF